MIRVSLQLTRVPRWQVLLHRLGYLTTALIALQLCYVAFHLVKAETRDFRRDVAQIAESRTFAGPLSPVEGDEWIRPHLIEHLGELKGLSELRPAGLRFVALPSFGRAEYALWLSLGDGDAQANGELRVIIRGEDNQTEVKFETLDISATRAEAAALFNEIDALTRNYAGQSDGVCVDGTAIGYERIAGQAIWSGGGNCQRLYVKVRSLVLNFVRSNVKSPLLPTEDDWHHMADINIDMIS